MKKNDFFIFEKLAEGIGSFDLVGLFECLLNDKAKNDQLFTVPPSEKGFKR